MKFVAYSFLFLWFNFGVDCYKNLVVKEDGNAGNYRIMEDDNSSCESLMDVVIQSNNFKIQNLTVKNLQADYLPLIVDKFRALEALKVSQCGELNFPKNFEGPVNITVLIATNNSYKTIETNSFKYFHRLTNLNLSANGIEVIESGAFEGLLNLNYLELGSNKIKALTKEMFVGLPNLISLRLANNSISHLSNRSFEHLTSLWKLLLNGNEITDIDADAFCNLRKLQKLDLSDNKLVSIKRGTFRELHTLSYLNLERNSLRILYEHLLDGLKHLSMLLLSNNKIFAISPKIVFPSKVSWDENECVEGKIDRRFKNTALSHCFHEFEEIVNSSFPISPHYLNKTEQVDSKYTILSAIYTLLIIAGNAAVFYILKRIWHLKSELLFECKEVKLMAKNLGCDYPYYVSYLEGGFFDGTDISHRIETDEMQIVDNDIYETVSNN